jgi:hypothetical protein
MGKKLKLKFYLPTLFKRNKYPEYSYIKIKFFKFINRSKKWTIRSLVKTFGISLKTAFLWVHKFLYRSIDRIWYTFCEKYQKVCKIIREIKPGFEYLDGNYFS